MRTFLCSVLTLVTLAWGGAAAGQGLCGYPYRVGFQVTEMAGLKVALSYPTLTEPVVYPYSSGFDGYVAPNAAPGCGPVPLVVFSHGLGGCGTQSLFFTEELARHGYVVAATDHQDAALCSVDGTPGNLRNLRPPREPFADPAEWSDATYVDRQVDLEDLIDALLATPSFASVIDANAIGAAGHSLGGYTVLGLAGGWASWKDARVRAVLAMSPYVEPYLLHESLSAFGAPVMYQGAQLDIGITPTLEGPDGAYAKTRTPKYFAKLHGGTHFVWSNAGCHGTPSVQACLANVRDPAMIDRFAIAFFDACLRRAPAPILIGPGFGLAEYDYAR